MQVSSKLRKGEAAYFHWCPGCESMHALPFKWKFNGDLEKPTFTPSFKQAPGTQFQCHYILTNGVLDFCSDSAAHKLRGPVPLPDLPDWMQD